MKRLIFIVLIFCACAVPSQNVEVNKKVSEINSALFELQFETAQRENEVYNIDEKIREINAKIEILRFKTYYISNLVDSLENNNKSLPN